MFSAFNDQRENPLTGKYQEIEKPNYVNFTKTVVNIGGGLDMATGTFTSPVDGTYMFSFSGVAHDWILMVGIYVNGVQSDRIFIGNGAYYGNFGYTWFSNLKTGDEVRLKIDRGSINLWTRSWPYFNGILVKLDD